MSLDWACWCDLHFNVYNLFLYCLKVGVFGSPIPDSHCFSLNTRKDDIFFSDCSLDCVGLLLLFSVVVPVFKHDNTHSYFQSWCQGLWCVWFQIYTGCWPSDPSTCPPSFCHCFPGVPSTSRCVVSSPSVRQNGTVALWRLFTHHWLRSSQHGLPSSKVLGPLQTQVSSHLALSCALTFRGQNTSWPAFIGKSAEYVTLVGTHWLALSLCTEC